jgi:hypothetical protein
MKIVLSIALFLSSLSLHANNITNLQKLLPVDDTTYSYYDAARNKYILHDDTIEYIPVKPVESSSGVYDGGQYTKKGILAADRDKLLFLFKKASTTKKAQTDKNVKPNAVVEIKTGNKKTSFLLKATSPINIEIKLFLPQLITK